MENREIEAKFLEIDKEALISKLKSLGAEDLGEDFLKEMIFYPVRNRPAKGAASAASGRLISNGVNDALGDWAKEGKTFVRIRERTPSQSPPIRPPEAERTGGEKRDATSPSPSPSPGEGRIRLTYKNLEAAAATGTEEIELGIENGEKAKDFLEKIGLKLHRQQEKKRRTFKLDEVSVDIDTWPKVPTYVELEGPSEDAIKAAAKKLGFDWKKAIFANSRMVLEKYYKVPIGKLKYFTFDKIE